MVHRGGAKAESLQVFRQVSSGRYLPDNMTSTKLTSFFRFPVKMVHVGQSLPEMKSIAAAVGGDSSSSQGLGNVGPSASDVDQS